MRHLAILAMLFAPAADVQAQTWSLELMGGSAYNLPTPLTVSQAGYPDVSLTAHYDTKPFGPFLPYYSGRLRVWIKHRPWELQLVHHRLFLANTTDEIQRFNVHFGYNYILAGRAWRTHGVLVHAGAGVIVPNPENIVRGRGVNTGQVGAIHTGYGLSGVGGSVLVSREATLASHMFLVAEGGAMFARATVPVVDGSAHVPNVGLHGRVGVGLVF
jgi:hypothetical protein